MEKRDHELLMTIDVGTTSVKCMLFNKYGKMISRSSESYVIISEKPNWLEQNPLDWWDATCKSIRNCLKSIRKEHIIGISFSGQMSAPVLVDKNGNPEYNSLLIADTRSTKQANFLQAYYYDCFIHSTGNEPIDAFTVTKLLWLKENMPGILNKTYRLLFPKDFIRYKLTNKMGTEPTDAGNSLLYDVKNKSWDWELIKELQIPSHIFPDIYEPSELFGYVTDEAANQTGLAAGIPIITGAADMACSQLGSGAIKEGVLTITLSTSGQIVASTPSIHQKGVGKVTFHNSVIENQLYTMGTLFTGGLGVEWGYKFLFNKNKMVKEDYQKLDQLTKEMEDYLPGSNGLLFLPFLVGSATPYFDPKDRAAWVGLRLKQEKSLLLHSILEGISFNIMENVNVMKEMNIKVDLIHLGAGGSKNKKWSQIISDMLGIDLITLKERDCSSLGAAIIAGVGVGVYNSFIEGVNLTVKGLQRINSNNLRQKTYKELFSGYQEVYTALNRYYKI